MKHGWKTFWIVTACVAGVGLLLCGIGVAAGMATGGLKPLWNEYKSRTHMIVKFPDDNEVDWDDEEDEEWEMDGRDWAYSFDASNIQNFELQAGGCEIEIEHCDGDKILIDDSELEPYGTSILDVTQPDDTSLCINLGGRHRGGHHQEHGVDGTLYIYIPRGTVFETASFSLGAAVLESEAMQAEHIVIEVGAGSISMKLEGRPEDYDYSLECGMGEISIGEDSYGGLATSKTIDHGADKKVEISCGMGEVEIEF